MSNSTSPDKDSEGNFPREALPGGCISRLFLPSCELGRTVAAFLRRATVEAVKKGIASK